MSQHFFQMLLVERVLQGEVTSGSVTFSALVMHLKKAGHAPYKNTCTCQDGFYFYLWHMSSQFKFEGSVDLQAKFGYSSNVRIHSLSGSLQEWSGLFSTEALVFVTFHPRPTASISAGSHVKHSCQMARAPEPSVETFLSEPEVKRRKPTFLAAFPLKEQRLYDLGENSSAVGP
jgi:hypothetical protein